MSKQLHILVISNYNDPINPVRPEAEIYLSLIDLGFIVTVMTEKGSTYAELLRKKGADVIDYRPKRKIDFEAMALIRECVHSGEVDVVHAFNSKAIVNSTLALWRNKVKIVGYRGYTGNIKWYDLSSYVAFLNPRLDYMVCLADSVREMFIKNGMPKHKAVTIHKGHKAEWYDHIEKGDLSEFNFPAEATVFALIANNRTKMKGIHVLVEASDLIPANHLVRFLLIGRGMDTPEIKDMISKTLNPERFVFAGFRDNVLSLVKACDVSISASLFGEATQKAMIEAMYLGNPVVITDIPGNKNLAVDKAGGRVVAPGDAQTLAQGITWMLENKDRLSDLGTAAKKHISEFLGNDKTVKSYAEFYTRITVKK